MSPSILTEADARYLTEVGSDCKTWLGPGAELLGLRRDDAEGQVRLIARFRLGGREYESVGSGDNPLEAHSVLRARILFERLRIGYAKSVEPR